MNRVLIQKGISVALILSGLVLLVLKAMSIPEAIESANSWAAPNNGTPWVVGILSLELLLLAARFALGSFLFLNKPIKPWLFYPLILVVGASGLSGIILCVPVLILRFWLGGSHAVKT